MDQYIGKMLDNRYEILECIGTGGMAVVYKARCHRLNRLVAVKILKPELASDADFRRRFHDESQAVAMLSHTNIVSVYDVSHSDGLDYIVMELIDGMTLKQYMKKRGTPLNWREALHFITQIVRALGHAHSRGIIHRDIKPQNMLVLRDGSVKVADFGIARLASAAQATLTQEALGSVHYISPEQAKGSHVDGRSDLYSAGVVLYEMLTGRLPFEGETPVFVAIQHINSIPIAPRELNPDIPPALEAITMKAMAPNPDQRYASADEMLTDLKEFRKNPGAVIVTAEPKEEEEVDEPTMVVPVANLTAIEKTAPKPPERRQEPPERKRERPESSGSVKNRQRWQPEEEEEEEDPPRHRRGIPPILIAILIILLFIGGIAYFLYNFLIQGLFSQTPEYKVPDLRGHTVEEIQADPTILGDFQITVGSTVYNTEYSEGQICAQVPAAYEVVRAGNLTITVTVSGGQDNMYMVDVLGQDARQALKTLQDEMHLSVTQEYEFSPTVTKGYVISFWPIEGTSLKEGDEVGIVISKGPEVATAMVPSFINVDIERVAGQVESLGLIMGRAEEFYDDEYPAGRVIWQSIPPTTVVDAGTTIDFQVSKGPEPTPSPEPTPEVTPDPSPEPSEAITEPPIPTASTSVQTIIVDLSDYSGYVLVEIKVGNSTVFNSSVNSADGILVREVSGSGTQQITIYIDGNVVNSYPQEF